MDPENIPDTQLEISTTSPENTADDIVDQDAEPLDNEGEQSKEEEEEKTPMPQGFVPPSAEDVAKVEWEDMEKNMPAIF